MAYISGEESLVVYLKEISRVPLLTAEEERRLAREAISGSNESCNKLILSNLRFVVSMARQYNGRGLSLSDLIAEGNLGLLKAVKKFNPDANCRFTTYAVWWIKQALQSAIDNCSRTIRLPAEKSQAVARIRVALDNAYQNSGGMPTGEDISKAARVVKGDVNRLLSLSEGTSSLDVPLTEGVGALVDTVPDTNRKSPEEHSLLSLLKSSIESILNILKPREAYVMKRRFGLDGSEPGTLRQIGREIGVSRERVRQIEQEVLARIRTDFPSLSAFAG